MSACEWCEKTVPPKVPSAPGRQRTIYCTENCRKRAHEDRSRGTCACGAKLGRGTGYASHARRAEMCRKCRDEQRAAERYARLERAAALYNDGVPTREIAVALGYKPTSKPPELVDARRAGLITTYRYRGYGRVAA